MVSYDSPSDLREALSAMAIGRGSDAEVLARMQRVMLQSREAMSLAARPNVAKRNALFDAMYALQTEDGRKYASCLVCGLAMSKGEGPTASHATLTVLIPSTLFRTDEADEVAATLNTSAQSGWVPGNIALACKACNNARPAGDMLTADVITDPSMVMRSWAGVGSTKRSVPEDNAESIARRAKARKARGLSF